MIEQYLNLLAEPRMQIGLCIVLSVALLGRYVVHSWIYAHKLIPREPNPDVDGATWMNETEEKRWERVKFVLDNLEIHRTARWFEPLLYLGLLLAGMDPLYLIATMNITRVFTQGLINIGSSRPFVDPNENDSYGVQKDGVWYKRVQKRFTGWGRVWLAIGSIALFFYRLLI